MHVDSTVNLSVFGKNVKVTLQFIEDFQPDIIHTFIYGSIQICYYLMQNGLVIYMIIFTI